MEDVLDIIDPDTGDVDDFDKELMEESEKTTTTAATSSAPVKPVVKPQPSVAVVKRKEPEKRKMEESQVGWLIVAWEARFIFLPFLLFW